MTKDYLDLTNVESIKVAKGLFRDANNLKTGKVFITSKNKNHNWMTLADLKTTIPIVDPCRQIMYIIDGNLIEDTSGVRIEV